MLISICQPDTNQDIIRKRESNWGFASIRLDYMQVYKASSSWFNDWCGKVQIAVVGIIVALGYIKKQTEQALGKSKWAVFFHGLCFRSCHGFPQLWTMMWNCKANKPFSSQAASGYGPYHSNIKKTRTIPKFGTYWKHSCLCYLFSRSFQAL